MSELQRARYLDRKSRQVCVTCETPLGDTDGAYCATCEEDRQPAQVLWRASDHGRAVRLKNQNEYIQRRYKAGLCVVCCLSREQWAEPTPAQKAQRDRLGKPPQKCPTCSDDHTAYNRRRNRMIRDGVISLARERRRRELEAKRAAAAAALEQRERVKRIYRPADEVIASTRYRLLSTIARFDWIATGELWDVLGLPAFEVSRTERDRFAKTLERYVKSGLIRYRDFISSGATTGRHKPKGLRNGGTYKITEDGREALADLRAEIAKGIAC